MIIMVFRMRPMKSPTRRREARSMPAGLPEHWRKTISQAASILERGFDHGLFIPLKLMYPQADIPCLQLSLLRGLNPARILPWAKRCAH